MIYVYITCINRCVYILLFIVFEVLLPSTLDTRNRRKNHQIHWYTMQPLWILTSFCGKFYQFSLNSVKDFRRKICVGFCIKIISNERITVIQRYYLPFESMCFAGFGCFTWPLETNKSFRIESSETMFGQISLFYKEF